jgi:hypothetical protein
VKADTVTDLAVSGGSFAVDGQWRSYADIYENERGPGALARLWQWLDADPELTLALTLIFATCVGSFYMCVVR